MASFITELKQRNVVKVAVAYAIVAWVLIEITATVFPILKLPEWTVTLVTLLLLLGFPVALLLSWAFELTPEGIKSSKSVEPADSIAKATGRKLDFIIIGVLSLGVILLVFENYVLVDEPAPVANEFAEDVTPTVDAIEEDAAPIEDESQREVLPNSVAVLPLENLSLDPDNAYFAAGIHEEILNHLAKLSQLNIISRTSMVRYADSDLSIPEIAAELNVETVMEGSVRYADGRVLVTMQLIDPETDAHLWSESYNREFADVFAIQADIAMNVANALQAEFSLAEQEEIEAVPTDSPEAYSLYLRALSLGGGTRVLDAITEYLDAAIRLDPNFALAYARKATLHAVLLAGNVPGLQTEYERIAQENAEQALALDNTLGHAHAALAFVYQAHWRWDEADQEWAEALRLNPNSSNILVNYSRTKIFRGDYDEAIESGQRAVDLNPRSLGAYYYLGISHLYARNHDAAAEIFRRALEINSAAANLHFRLGITEGIRGNWEIAVSELQFAEQLYGENMGTLLLPMFANGYAHIEQRDDVERFFNALKARAENSPVNAARWALMYIALEEFDQALEWLEVAVENEAPDLVNLGAIKANPYAIAALDEPRFKTLRDRIGQ